MDEGVVLQIFSWRSMMKPSIELLAVKQMTGTMHRGPFNRLNPS
jgi:hypothetical protein